MAKHEHDEIADYHIIGRGTYDNLRRARPYEDEQVFAIVPRPRSWAALAAVNLIFVAFFATGFWFCYAHAQSHRQFGLYAIPAIGLVTCGLYTAYYLLGLRRELRLGPWLIYEKQTGRLILPRESEVFERDQIVHLQLITSNWIQWAGEGNSELNLITEVDGERRRWALLRENATVSPLMYIVKPILAATDLPVFRYRKKRGHPVEIIDMRDGKLEGEWGWY